MSGDGNTTQDALGRFLNQARQRPRADTAAHRGDSPSPARQDDAPSPARQGDASSPARQGDAVAQFLDTVRQAKRPAPGARKGRLIFAMDATASREPSWDQAVDVQARMFQETASLGGLDVQLVYYRGFNECRASRFVDQPMHLVDLMTKVRCLAGRTQLARVFKHAIKATQDKRVDALVFVGDCFEENLDLVAESAGQLGVLGVKAFLFQEGHNAQASQAFRHLAQLTGGAHCAFDLSSPEQLRQLLAAVAVYAAGGAPALEDYAKRGGRGAKLLTSRMG